MAVVTTLVEQGEIGSLGVVSLKRLWARWIGGHAVTAECAADEWRIAQLLLGGLGLGQEQVMRYVLGQRPDFATFEDWIVANNGGSFDPDWIARLNAALTGAPPPSATLRQLHAIEAAAPVLDADDLAHWHDQGWVLLRGAITPEAAHACAEVVWRAQRMSPDDPTSWGHFGPHQQCVFVQVFRHPALDASRRSPRIHKAFAQLWGTADLWPSTDRIGFNPPESSGVPFPGPGIHWDVSLVQPIPLGIQGLIYLTDTDPDQGAFALVPGMQRTIGDWLRTVPPGVDPRQHAVDTLTMTPIGGQAGDMVLWHHALAHGPTPNRASQPRLVQYLKMFPADFSFCPEWL